MNRVLVQRKRKANASGASSLLRSLTLVTVGILSATAHANDEFPVSSDPNAPELAYAVVNATGEQVAYDVVDGMAMLDGDIILGTHAEVQANGIEPLSMIGETAGDCAAGFSCSSILASSRIWPNGIVPVTLSANTTEAGRAAVIAAIADWETKTSVRFIQRTNETDYIEFVSTGPGNTCSSLLGRAGGRQPINYAGTGQGCLVHEIGHAMGLNHEQNRNDRDEHVNIDFTNVAGNFQSQFSKATSSTDVGPYDFGSVMHYGPFTFAQSLSRPVITAIDPDIGLEDIGGVFVLSPIDVLGIEFVYGNSPTEPPEPVDPAPAPAPAPPAPPPTSAISAAATHNPGDVGLAIDGDPSTRWTTRTRQQPGMAFQLDLGTAQTVGSVTLDSEESPMDLPESYILTTSVDGSNFSLAASGNGTNGTTTINFTPRSARFVRVTQIGSKDRYWFSIHEMTVSASSGETTASADGPSRDGDWVRCASENETCSFSGEKDVAYGDGDTWVYASYQDSVGCDNRTFGDPLRGTVKSCFYSQ